MLIRDFYEIVDQELQELINTSEDPQYKKLKQDAQKKSYALLNWFLKFYGQVFTPKEYITDGDGDSSCDIIYSKTDSFGKTMFYVVQSKWNNINNCEKNFDSQDLKYSLHDFDTLLKGERKQTSNSVFNKKYSELLTHLTNNGEVKFIFLSLCLENGDCIDNIRSFERTFGPNVSVEIIDIKRIRRDYIDWKYKGLKTSGPLEYHYDPEESKIVLPIERFGEKFDRDFIDFNGSSRAYIFIIKPKTIFELFEKFGLSLFYKNVRNPLIKSNYNREIRETLEKRPGSFWYFNNGITAITKLVPEIGIQAQNVEITGLQIINGAQTVYSIYLAYKEANIVQREVMDTDARLTLRLIRSSDENFNFSITRYTNSQNEVKTFDFMSNEEIQIRLQNESFNTKVWYSRRRGEFIEESKPDNILIVPNYTFAFAYLAFHLQNPHFALEKRNLFFISRIDNPNGLYEVIFNEKTKYEDMLASVYVYLSLAKRYELGNDDEERKIGVLKAKNAFVINVLAISRVYLELYLKTKYPTDKTFNVSNYIITAFEKDETEKLRIISKVTNFCSQTITKDTEDFNTILERMIDSNNYYLRITDQIREYGLLQEDIDFIESNVIDESEQEAAASSEDPTE